MDAQNKDCGTNYQSAGFTLLPITSIKTTYSNLRSGNLSSKALNGLGSIPIRVVSSDNGDYEVVDGFKRLKSLQAEGAKNVLVIVEHASSEHERKRMILAANAPARTLTPLDEALVVRSLIETDNLSSKAAGDFLGKKKHWIMQRLMMARKLSKQSQIKLGNSEIGPTVGNLLTSLSEKDQDELTSCFSIHKLRICDQQRLIKTFRIAEPEEKKALISNPVEYLSTKSKPVFSPMANLLEKRLCKSLDLIEDLSSFSIPPEMSESETKRLIALAKQFLIKAKDSLIKLAKSITKSSLLKEFTYEKNSIERSERGYQKPDYTNGQEQRDKQPQNCKESWDITISGGESEKGSGYDARNIEFELLKDRAIQRGNSNSCYGRPDNHTNPERDTGLGLSRGENNLGNICKQTKIKNNPNREESKAQIRDIAWRGVPG